MRGSMGASDCMPEEQKLTTLSEKLPQQQAHRRPQRIIKRWHRSLARNVLRITLAYLVTALFYRFALHGEDSWLRAVGPVLAIATFVLIEPFIRRVWFIYERNKLPDSDRYL